MRKLKEAQILPVGCYTFLKKLGRTLNVLSLFRDALEPNVCQFTVYRLLGAFEFGHLITMHDRAWCPCSGQFKGRNTATVPRTICAKTTQ